MYQQNIRSIQGKHQTKTQTGRGKLYRSLILFKQQKDTNYRYEGARSSKWVGSKIQKKNNKL